ncbi:hypothetical protein ABPG74_017376 [Tetrahymena malaccensis]
MKNFRDFAKQVVKNYTSAFNSQNNQNIKDNLQKRVNNFADFLEKDKVDEQEQKQSQEDIYKQNIRQQYQKMDTEDDIMDQKRHFEQMTGKKINLNEQQQQQKEAQANKKENKPNMETSQNIPFMVTRAMKIELYNLGYELEQINDMTPKEANEIIQKKKFNQH